MEVFLGPGVFRGGEWLPDKLAAALVKEKQLEKNQTISKREIVDFLAKHNVSEVRATDVAIVLRNMYGLTPTFDEGREMSTALLSEVRAILDGDPDRVLKESADPAPTVITEEQWQEAFEQATTGAFCEAQDETDELVIAALSRMPLDDVIAIAQLEDLLTPEEIQGLDECYEAGGMKLVESWFDVKARPHMLRFLPEATQQFIAERQTARRIRELTGPRMGNVKRPALSPSDPRAQQAQRKHQERDFTTGLVSDKAKRAARAQVAAAQDPLAQRAQAAELGQTAMDRWKGMSRRERENVRSTAAAKASMREPLPPKRTAWDDFAPPQGAQSQTQAPAQAQNTPAQAGAQSPKPGWWKRAGQKVGAAVGDVASGFRSGWQSAYGQSPQSKPTGAPQLPAHTPSQEPALAPAQAVQTPAQKPAQEPAVAHGLAAQGAADQSVAGQDKPKRGMLSRIIGGAGKVIGNIGGGVVGGLANLAKSAGGGLWHGMKDAYGYGHASAVANMRQTMPGLAQAVHGDPSDLERNIALRKAMQRDWQLSAPTRRQKRAMNVRRYQQIHGVTGR